jgi:hypothetical protein
MRVTDDSHRVLLKALTEPQDNYCRSMRPADIIEQSMMEQRYKKPRKFADLLQIGVAILKGLATSAL